MVSLTEVKASNKTIATNLPGGLVAVFVGGTSGIGETALKQFVKHANKPHIYNIGRSQEAGDRIGDECKLLNSSVEYAFIKADVSLLKNVDEVCKDLKSKETNINLLFMTSGTIASADTAESLPLGVALPIYARTRFAANLLPLLRHAPSLRRVVTVFAGTKPGPINTSDFLQRSGSMLTSRGHLAATITFTLEALATQAPEVAFVHGYPGPVKGNFGRELKGPMKGALRLYQLAGPLFSMPTVEAGERHVFLATSARYGPAAGDGKGVDAAEMALGADGKVGSGVYIVDAQCESGDTKCIDVLGKMRGEGIGRQVWEHIEGEFVRITGRPTCE